MAETKQQNATRAQKAKALHEEKTRERKGEQQVLKAEYLKARESIVLQDILEKATKFSQYHVTVGRDGVGTRPIYNEAGNLVDQEVVYFSNEKRVSELDRSAGIQEIIDYINRMVADPLPEEKTSPEPQQESEA